MAVIKKLATTSATRQVRQRWFSVGIFPLRLLFGLTGNRPQSAPACSFLRYGQAYFCATIMILKASKRKTRYYEKSEN